MLRPILNFSLGRVESEGTVTPATAQAPGSRDALDFLGNGRLNAFGLGGSVMLDYERYRPRTRSTSSCATAISTCRASTARRPWKAMPTRRRFSLWSRYREPTGLTALERPLRYVLEYAYTSFLGDLRGVLGFTDVHSFGVGLELDSTNYDIYATRARLLLRYKIGNNVTGWAVGLGVSF